MNKKEVFVKPQPKVDFLFTFSISKPLLDEYSPFIASILTSRPVLQLLFLKFHEPVLINGRPDICHELVVEEEVMEHAKP